MNILSSGASSSVAGSLPLLADWDQRSLRQALGRFATGVTIVTTRRPDGSCVGLTANSFNSVSLDPALVLWCLGKGQGSSAVFRSSTHFAINILSSEQVELSRRFASPIEDRFAGVDYACDDVAAPLIRGCAAWFVCRHRVHHEVGDHVLFIGEVEAFGTAAEQPLLFCDGSYAVPESMSRAACSR
ncbi:MAG: flavin reductase family protein [Burkholderiaceae bacterium]